MLRSLRPYDGTVLWEGAVADEAAIAAAVARAGPVQVDWAAAGLETRIATVRAFAALVEQEAEPFAHLIAQETGKPLWEARTEVASVAAKVEISIAAQAERAGAYARTPEERITQAVRHKPHGVLAVLGPYNFPAHLPNGHIVPALLAGNAVLFKPSEHVPAVGAYMVGLWERAGLDPRLLQLVQGGAEVGRALASAAVDGLLFTGSAGAGMALARQFADTPWRMLALEMGGNNPLLAWDVEEGDLDAAAAIILQSAFISAGQRCTCARRLIVRDGRHRPLLDRLVGLVDRLIVDAPFAEPQPFMGPVIDNVAADRLLAAVGEMKGKVIRPMRRRHDGLPFLLPGIIDTTDMAVPDVELFGPLLQIIRVPDFGAAIREANNTRFGLATGLVGGNRRLYEHFWRLSHAGVVNWNRPTVGAASGAPFGGAGYSGNHRPSAWYAADYCAWPVASLETTVPKAPALQGVAHA